MAAAATGGRQDQDKDQEHSTLVHAGQLWKQCVNYVLSYSNII